MARLDAYFRSCGSSTSRSFGAVGCEEGWRGVGPDIVKGATSESQNQRPEMQVGAPVQYMRSRHASVLVRCRHLLPFPLPFSSLPFLFSISLCCQTVALQAGGSPGKETTFQAPHLDVQMPCLVILLGSFLLADTMCSRDIRVWCVCACASMCVRMCVCAYLCMCVCVCATEA